MIICSGCHRKLIPGLKSVTYFFQLLKRGLGQVARTEITRRKRSGIYDLLSWWGQLVGARNEDEEIRA